MERILHVLGSLDRGGAETRILELYAEIDRAAVQFDFLVLTPGEHCYDADVAALGGRKFYARHPRQHGALANLRDMLRIMTREGPFRAVHAHTSYHSGLVLLAARLAGIPCRVVHARTTSTSRPRSLPRRLSVSAGRLLIRTNATSLLAISPEAARYVFGNRVCDSGRSTIVPNAINLTPYVELCEADSQELRGLLAIPANALVLGCVGRFSPMKNQEFLLPVVRRLRAKGLDARLVLVGDGERRGLLEGMARAQGVEHCVYFLGVRGDIARLDRMFDVFVMPSLFEGLGGAAIEAQAAGTPCVLSTGLPPSSDMGLDLVRFLPVADAGAWAHAVLEQARLPRPRFDAVRRAFEDRGFTIANEWRMYLAAYGFHEASTPAVASH